MPLGALYTYHTSFTGRQGWKPSRKFTDVQQYDASEPDGDPDGNEEAGRISSAPVLRNCKNISGLSPSLFLALGVIKFTRCPLHHCLGL